MILGPVVHETIGFRSLRRNDNIPLPVMTRLNNAWFSRLISFKAVIRKTGLTSKPRVNIFPTLASGEVTQMGRAMSTNCRT